MFEVAKELIEKEKRERTGKLDLGRCGLRDLNAIPELFELEWLKELNFSNRWWDHENREWVESQNKGEKTRLSALPPALCNLGRLEIMRINGDYDGSWQTSDIRVLEKITPLTSLYLSYNKISDYSFLKKITSLASLELSDNRIRDIRFLAKITSLTSLNLSYNQIHDIRFLEKLTSLTSLNLNSNQINDIRFLEKLTSLTSLNLSYNKINDIRFLEKLTSLTSLNLSYNKINDIRFLEKLTSLTSLNLSSNQIHDIRFLEKLTSLTSLNLSSNIISDYSFLEKLTSLTSLNLSSNQIHDIRFLEKLTSLTSLNLSSNKINDIRFLEKLTSLTSLNLSSNQIHDIRFLEKLTSLTSLNLAENKISGISPLLGLIQKGTPITLGEYDHGKGINLSNNPIAVPPLEIVKQGNEAILRYFVELKKGQIHNNEIKLILVGNSTAGKTSMSRFLRERKFDKSQQSTHGGDLMQVWRPEGHDLKVNIWDFGGQEYYHATHRLFLNDNAVYALVWESETNKSDFADTDIYYEGKGLVRESLEHFRYTYWLDTIRHYAPESPVLMVCNKCETSSSDRRIKDTEIQRFRLGPDAFEFSLSIVKAFEYQENIADVKNKKWARAFEDFEETLLKNLKASAVKYALVRYWVDIRDEMIWRSTNQRFLTWAEYEDLCREYDETPDVELAMLYLRDISGSVLHYPHNPLLKDKVYIDTNWINRCIYTVLDYEVKEQHGHFDFTHVKTVLNVPEAEAHEMIALMLEFELIFEDARQPGHFIAPQYLPHHHKEGFESARHFANLSPVLTLRFPNFLPRSVLARFIARVGFHAVPNQFWKFGILFQQGLSALVECIYGDVPRIEIAIQKGEEKARKALVKDIFELLLEIMEGEGDFEVSVAGSAFVPYQEIKKAYATKAEAVLSIDNQLLNRSLLDIVKPKTIVSKQQVFLSYAREDSEMKDRLEKHLSTLKTSGKIATWQDGEILPGIDWDEKIKQELHNADIILLLISADFIASDYIWNTEIQAAWERHKHGEAVVIPILLRPCDVTDIEFMQLQGLPKGLKPVSSFDHPDEAFNQIAMEVRRVVDARISQ